MIRFSKYIWLYILISSLVLVPGIYSLVRYGLRPSVDFTGGTLLELQVQTPMTTAAVQDLAVKASIPMTSIQKTASSFIVRMGQTSEESMTAFQTSMTKASGKPVEVLRKDTVGPVLGKELLFKSVIAALLAVVAILSYVAYAFKDIKYGVSAVLALIHDVLVVFGLFSLFGHFFGVEVDTLFVTAFLTTMSSSVHDTIVIFDRIREYRRKDTKTDFVILSDIALTETMGRSLINSFTIIFMLLALVLLGGTTVHWFAVALLIGSITGTYSSPFIATPIVLLWNHLEEKKKQTR